jgi:Nucleotidyltransferase domain
VPLQIVDDYLAELARRMQEILGDDLVAVYAGGSYALGAYEHGRSDIDVTAVVEGPLPDDTKQALVATLRHEALPCPARGLELVIYPRATVEHPTAEPGFELNLNTGARMDFRADFAPGDIEGFWFAIDRSILREHGLPVLGPPPGEVFAPIPRAVIAPVIEESMRWHGGDTSDNAALNTARSQHFLDTGHWISKLEARQRLDASQGAP